MGTEKPRCKAIVPAPGMWLRYTRCSRAAVEDGYCRQHHPEAKAKRDAAYKAALVEKMAGWRKEGRAKAVGYAVLALTDDEKAALPASVREALAK